MAKQKTPVRNKQRGKELEKEVVDLAKKFEFKVQRAWGSDGRALGLDETVDVLIENEVKVQCKRRKRLPKWMQIDTTKIDMVVTRQDKGLMFAMVPLVWLFKLMKFHKENYKNEGSV